ncbi:MAG TPA: hypothetical protein VF590_21725, partial [Isosphaeraceae bacterium]
MDVRPWCTDNGNAMQGMKAKAPKHLTFGQLWGRGWVAFFSIGPLAWGGLVWFPRLVAWLVADAASPAWKAVDFVLRLAILLVVLPWLLGVGVELSYPQLLESLLGRPEVGETPREDT